MRQCKHSSTENMIIIFSFYYCQLNTRMKYKENIVSWSQLCATFNVCSWFIWIFFLKAKKHTHPQNDYINMIFKWISLKTPIFWCENGFIFVYFASRNAFTIFRSWSHRKHVYCIDLKTYTHFTCISFSWKTQRDRKEVSTLLTIQINKDDEICP